MIRISIWIQDRIEGFFTIARQGKPPSNLVLPPSEHNEKKSHNVGGGLHSPSVLLVAVCLLVDAHLDSTDDVVSPSPVSTSARHSSPTEFISPLPNPASSSPSASVPIRHINKSLLLPMSFLSGTVGRNICLSPDCTVAVRRVEDYCNAYLFTPRPLHIRETIVIQVIDLKMLLMFLMKVENNLFLWILIGHLIR